MQPFTISCIVDFCFIFMCVISNSSSFVVKGSALYILFIFHRTYVAMPIASLFLAGLKNYSEIVAGHSGDSFRN